MIKFNTEFETAGDGYWSNVAKSVSVTGVGLGYVNDEEDFGELRVYFDTNTWDVNEDGLIYTDSLFLAMLRERLAACGFDATDVTYSEQGMQGDNYVSLDVGEKFLRTWFAVVDKVDL
jgi:hypothetical protein